MNDEKIIEKNMIHFFFEYEKKFGKPYALGWLNFKKELYCDYIGIYGSEEDFDHEPDSDFYTKIVTGELFEKIFEKYGDFLKPTSPYTYARMKIKEENEI